MLRQSEVFLTRYKEATNNKDEFECRESEPETKEESLKFLDELKEDNVEEVSSPEELIDGAMSIILSMVRNGSKDLIKLEKIYNIFVNLKVLYVPNESSNNLEEQAVFFWFLQNAKNLLTGKLHLGSKRCSKSQQERVKTLIAIIDQIVASYPTDKFRLQLDTLYSMIKPNLDLAQESGSKLIGRLRKQQMQHMIQARRNENLYLKKAYEDAWKTLTLSRISGPWIKGRKEYLKSVFNDFETQAFEMIKQEMLSLQEDFNERKIDKDGFFGVAHALDVCLLMRLNSDRMFNTVREELGKPTKRLLLHLGILYKFRVNEIIEQIKLRDIQQELLKKKSLPTTGKTINKSSKTPLPKSNENESIEVKEVKISKQKPKISREELERRKQEREMKAREAKLEVERKREENRRNLERYREEQKRLSIIRQKAKKQARINAIDKLRVVKQSRPKPLQEEEKLRMKNKFLSLSGGMQSTCIELLNGTLDKLTMDEADKLFVAFSGKKAKYPSKGSSHKHGHIHSFQDNSKYSCFVCDDHGGSHSNNNVSKDSMGQIQDALKSAGLDERRRGFSLSELDNWRLEAKSKSFYLD